MQIYGHTHLGHLTYCTNIHAGEAWPDVISSLRRCVPAIKQAVSPGAAFGIGLRLGASAADALLSPVVMQELQAFLRDNNCYVFTLNGFPFGPFHAQPVKENVYRPDWQTSARLSYTNQLADILVELLGEQEHGTISTVPGSFKPWLNAQATTDIAHTLVEHVAHLVKLREKTGKTLELALEPEPLCMLETIAETVDFFTRYLFSEKSIVQLQSATGLDADAAIVALRRHLGVCYDVCHAAVEFEDPVASIAALRNAGINIAKLQLSSAMRIADVSADTHQLLQRFVEPVYLHQVVEKTATGLNRYMDLPEALEHGQTGQGVEWRIHFHVPIFLQRMQDFDTTQAFLKDILALHRKDPISAHLEVETYTWDVLPDDYRRVDVSTAIAREINWVLSELTGKELTGKDTPL